MGGRIQENMGDCGRLHGMDTCGSLEEGCRKCERLRRTMYPSMFLNRPLEGSASNQRGRRRNVLFQFLELVRGFGVIHGTRCHGMLHRDCGGCPKTKLPSRREPVRFSNKGSARRLTRCHLTPRTPGQLPQISNTVRQEYAAVGRPPEKRPNCKSSLARACRNRKCAGRTLERVQHRPGCIAHKQARTSSIPQKKN